MADKSSRRSSDETQAYPAEKARQGSIVLRKRWQRVVFIAGLAAFVALVLLGSILMIGGGT